MSKLEELAREYNKEALFKGLVPSKWCANFAKEICELIFKEAEIQDRNSDERLNINTLQQIIKGLLNED